MAQKLIKTIVNYENGFAMAKILINGITKIYAFEWPKHLNGGWNAYSSDGVDLGRFSNLLDIELSIKG